MLGDRLSMKTESGFSLIEVLVAVLIVAVGVLGIAGLQVISMQMNRSALFRLEAIQLGNDMLDRMRANSVGVYEGIGFDDEPTLTTNCRLENCNIADLTEFDIAVWKCSINPFDGDGDPYSACADLGIAAAAALPEGAGSIALAGGVHSVSVQWQTDVDGTIASITLQGRVRNVP